MIKSFLWLFLLLNTMEGAFGAGTLPWNYFYSCGSGAVDCADFEPHRSSGSSYWSVQPLTGDPYFDSQWRLNYITASNQSGQSIGCGFYGTGCALIFGNNGHVSFLNLGPDSESAPGDINESGFWVISPGWMYGTFWGSGSTQQGSAAFLSLIDGITLTGTSIVVTSAVALNEEGDLLMRGFTCDERPSAVYGVLTERPVPEPAAAALGAAGLALLWVLRRAAKPSCNPDR